MNGTTHCPRCSRALAVAEDAIIPNPGPEGPLHVVGCTICGWHRTRTHIVGINRTTTLKHLLERRNS
jgi:RNase P subunit RPR2